MKILKSLGVIFLLSIIILNYGCTSCSKDGTSTNGNTIVDFYPPPESCGNACLYYPNAFYTRIITKMSTTATDPDDSSVLAWGTFLYIENGWKNEVLDVKISGKNIDKYYPSCGAGTGCLTTSCENAEKYGRVSCSVTYKEISDFSNQDTYILKVTTSSYGELSINVPLSNVKFIAPVHITSPFDSDAITDKSQLPIKVTLSNGSFTLTWDYIDGATGYSISSAGLNVSKYIKENITSYTFQNVSPGRFSVGITAESPNSTVISSYRTDRSQLIIEIETQ